MGCDLKTMEMLDHALIGACAVIRSNTVYVNQHIYKYNIHVMYIAIKYCFRKHILLYSLEMSH